MYVSAKNSAGLVQASAESILQRGLPEVACAGHVLRFPACERIEFRVSVRPKNGKSLEGSKAISFDCHAHGPEQGVR
jgi:hypothetical protein